MKYIIGQIFWYGILATPVIAFSCVRKFKGGLFHKSLGGIAIALALATAFYYLAAITVFLGYGI